jgi:hypothetical protein
MKPLCAIVLMAIGLCSCAPKQAPVTVAPATGPVLRSLFNGQDLSGWRPVGSAIWRVDHKDGWPDMIVGGQDGDPKRSGLLTTLDQFQNFQLNLEFMIDEHGKYNSGVYFRNSKTDTGAIKTGYQVNIGRGAAQEYCGGLYTDHWLAKGDETDTIRKPLEWNALQITAQGPHITVFLNYQKVVDYTDPNPDPRLLAKGGIALQTYGAEGHAGWVKFRKLTVKELP